MARIIERDSAKHGKRYTAQIRVGSHSEAKTFSTKTAAKDWAKKREIELKEKPHLAASEAHRHTLAAAIDRYLADYLPKKSASMVDHQTRQLAWWKVEHGDLPLSLVQAPLLVEARDRLARSPKQRGEGTLSPASVNRHLAAISTVLGLAYKEWHWISTNPMEAVKKLKENNERTRYLDDAGENNELVRLLEACRISESPYLYEYVLLVLTTGGRRNEVLGLTWDRVDLKAGTVTFDRTKNKSIRRVAIGAEIVELLRTRQGIGKALVFPSPNDPSQPVDIRSAWETALRRAGIQDFRIHDLRHTAASYLAMEGASSVELAGVLGHKTLSMVKRYSHLSPEHVAEVSTRIGARVARKLGGE